MTTDLPPYVRPDTVAAPTGAQLRNALSYAATALAGSGDNGDRYAAAQIAALLGDTLESHDGELPTVEGIAIEPDDRSEVASRSRARRYASAIADSAAAHTRIDVLTEDLAVAEYHREVAEHQLYTLTEQVHYAGTTVVTASDDAPGEGVNALLDLGSCHVWSRVAACGTYGGDQWVRLDVTANPMRHTWPLDGGPFVPILEDGGVASTMNTIGRLHQHEADLRRLLWNRPTGSKSTQLLEPPDQYVARVLTAIDDRTRALIAALDEAVAVSAGWLRAIDLMAVQPVDAAVTDDLTDRTRAVHTAAHEARTMTQRTADARATARTDAAATRLEDATEAVWGAVGPGAAEDLTSWMTVEQCARVAAAVLAALD